MCQRTGKIEILLARSILRHLLSGKWYCSSWFVLNENRHEVDWKWCLPAADYWHSTSKMFFGAHEILGLVFSIVFFFLILCRFFWLKAAVVVFVKLGSFMTSGPLKERVEFLSNCICAVHYLSSSSRLTKPDKSSFKTCLWPWHGTNMRHLSLRWDKLRWVLRLYLCLTLRTTEVAALAAF